MSGTAIDQVNSKENPRKVSHFDRNKLATISTSGCESSILALPQRSVLRTGYVDVQQIISSMDQHPDKSNKLKFMETTQLVISNHERSLFEEDLDIEWSDLDLKEKLGRGICCSYKNATACLIKFYSRTINTMTNRGY